MGSPLDIRTLTFASTAIILVLFGYLVYFQRTRKTYPGFGSWTLGALAMSAGLALITLRGLAPDLLSIVAANFLMFLDVVLILRGLAAFCGLRRAPWGDAGVLIAYTGLIWWFSLVQPSLHWRVVLLSICFAWYLAHAAVIAAGPAARLLGSRNWLLIASLAGTGAYYALRALLTLAEAPSSADYLTPNPFQAMTLVLSFVSHILVLNGLVMLNVQRLERELVQAQGEVTMLSGLLPICAGCKRIRDERGGWHQVEAYISRHSQAEFSHGICPDCLSKHYPEVADAILKD